jgi:hypothetical protein
MAKNKQIKDGDPTPAAVLIQFPSLEKGTGQLKVDLSYCGEWVNSEVALPDDGEAVLILTDDYILGFGYFMDDEWEIQLPPWNSASEDTAEVIFWTTQPSHP